MSSQTSFYYSQSNESINNTFVYSAEALRVSKALERRRSVVSKQESNLRSRLKMSLESDGFLRYSQVACSKQLVQRMQRNENHTLTVSRTEPPVDFCRTTGGDALSEYTGAGAAGMRFLRKLVTTLRP